MTLITTRSNNDGRMEYPYIANDAHQLVQQVYPQTPLQTFPQTKKAPHCEADSLPAPSSAIRK